MLKRQTQHIDVLNRYFFWVCWRDKHNTL